jgi:hypothetical protein
MQQHKFNIILRVKLLIINERYGFRDLRVLRGEKWVAAGRAAFSALSARKKSSRTRVNLTVSICVHLWLELPFQGSH